MTREEIANALFNRLELECPGLIHSYDSRLEGEDYADTDIADIIVAVCSPWSRSAWLRGEYGVRRTGYSRGSE